MKGIFSFKGDVVLHPLKTENRPKPKTEGSSSNHPFSGAILVFGNVDIHNRFCFPDFCPTVSSQSKTVKECSKGGLLYMQGPKGPTENITDDHNPWPSPKWVWFTVGWFLSL